MPRPYGFVEGENGEGITVADRMCGLSRTRMGKNTPTSPRQSSLDEHRVQDRDLRLRSGSTGSPEKPPEYNRPT